MPFMKLGRCLLCQIFILLVVLQVLSLSPLLSAQESFLVTASDNSFGVYDMATYTLQETMTAGYYTHSVNVGVNPRLAFLSANTEPMSVVDLTIGREIKKIPNVWGTSATLSNDGTSVLVWDDQNSTLDIIDVASLAVTQRVNLMPVMGSQAANGGTVVQVGTKAFLAPSRFSFNGKSVAGVVDLSTFQVTAIPLPFTSYSYFQGWTGNAIATPDGAYVAMVVDVYQGQDIPEMVLINTSTYAVTTKMLAISYPNAIVVTPNKSDPTMYFGYVTGADPQTFNPVAAVADFRPGSSTYGQILPSTIVQLNTFNRDSSGSGLAINSDGSKIVISGDGQMPPAPNLLVLDTEKMLNDPENAIINSQSIAGGASLYGLGIGTVNLIPPSSAPTVTGVEGNVINNQASQITVTGTNFMNGALVRIGGTAPLAATVNNASSLQVTVPVNAPADPGLDIIVTNPETGGGLDQQYQSGLLAGQLAIGLNPAFLPAQQFASLNAIGGGTVRMFDLTQREMLTLTASPNPALNAIEFAADGADLFGANYADVSAWNTATGQMRGSQLFMPGSLAIRRPLAPSLDPLSGKPVVYAPTASATSPYDLLLAVIDADPQSPTFNMVLRQIAAGLSYTTAPTNWAVVSRPDGHYVYAFYTHLDPDGATHLAIYDTVDSTAVVVPMDRFNVLTGQYQPTISADGKYLVLTGNNSSGGYQLKVFDIGTNPISPRIIGVITPPRMRGVTNFNIQSYVISGSHLFALGLSNPNIVAFNFNPANNDYRAVAIYRLPGDEAAVFAPLAASPDGKYLYVAIEYNSLLAVLDPNMLALGLDPLVTTIADSDSAHYLAASPVPPPSRLKKRPRPAITRNAPAFKASIQAAER